MEWDAWCRAFPAKKVSQRPDVSDDCEFASRVGAEKYKEFRELTDEISYRVVEFDGWFFVIGSLSDPDPDGD